MNTPDASEPGGSAKVGLSRLRKRIAQNVSESRRTAAHVWTSVEVDYEALEQVRRRHRSGFREREGFSLTYLPFIATATIDALAAFGEVNSSVDFADGSQTMHEDVNLGIAVDLDRAGLIVVVIHKADDLSLVELARAIHDLAGRARAGDIRPADVSGSTFTITNPGSFGSFMSAPIINVPNVAILATDGVAKRPTVVTGADGGDSVAVHHIGHLGLSWDHRAFDGSSAALFLGRIRDSIQTWDWEEHFAGESGTEG
ncbi:MAG: 2-oxo acid dehydrogenase subunit E2 [Acidimicrobiia bacterium]|nr:2-oxo acid dehydrogenase subunit E2 [Acidimicrobiia bacterium]MYC44242.1 2-oxo acid dehydrogenase subunit E2 [Acidimicrobiia bacterium]MYI19311.1 2-oxo acid dehydrogenase subunit E2 [Acidimicrobiia bacterium]